ncbi:hypothetical protein GCM10009416_02240 [Craurococcus roseus]|uniref:Uncharacterized protein n=1 Tax=Craurococcus roseus TaxID=77585 RepID=A0ABN1EJ85_9PROT
MPWKRAWPPRPVGGSSRGWRRARVRGSGGRAPEAWRWEEVRAELDAGRLTLAAAEAFARAAEADGLAPKAGPASASAEAPPGPAQDAALGHTGGGRIR